MADKVIGLDVGTNAVRAVAVTLGDRPRLQLMGQVGLPAGAVKDGEVVDPAAVAGSLRQLWKEVGFKSRSVRVAIASARVILRVIDMPHLSEGDTRAALRFQLGDYIPLPPEATVFDFQPLRSDEGGQGPERQLLLAAAPKVAIEPLMEAVKQGGLKVAAVDVVAAALARTLASTGSGGDGPGPVEAMVSIGAATIVVVVARDGQPLFSRTVTNVSGRQVTDRIASELSLQHGDAELLKRQVPAGAPADLAARVLLATDPFLTEITEEIGDSLDYYAAQAGSLPLDRVAITGGGALLVGLRERLERRLAVPVRLADPFEGLTLGATGFAPEDLPHVAPFMSVAIGTALGGAEGKSKRIDLTPESAARTARSRTPVLVGSLAVAVLAGGGYLYLGQNSSLSAATAQREQVEQAIDRARQLAATRIQAVNATNTRQASVSALVQYARVGDVDWFGVSKRLDGIGEPLGVVVTGIVGAARDAPTSAASAGTTAGGTTSAGQSAPTTTVAPSTPGPGGAPASTTSGTGNLTVTGTAADLNAVAAWIDAVAADHHFSDVWVESTTKTTDSSGATQLQFTATVVLGANDLVARKLPEATQP
jgi:type IV pilus assembly protein PilM